MTRETFLQRITTGKRVPVTRELLADTETPLSAYWKLAHDEPVSFLLESVTGGEQVSRYSMIGIRPTDVFRHRLQDHSSDGLDDLFAALGEPIESEPGLPRFLGGAVGVIAYDWVRGLEPIGPGPDFESGEEEMIFLLQREVVVFDHARNLIHLVVLAEPKPQAYDQALDRLNALEAKLRAPLQPLPSGKFPVHPVTSNFTQEEFESVVRKLKAEIAAGEGVQVVPSQRFQTRVDAHPVTVYRALRSLNPSPYMFLLRLGDLDVVGASPEILLSLEGRSARVRPIAGTRPRGNSQAEDQEFEASLLRDEKERAEHLMLIDLGRNDLGRVCEAGSITIQDLMVVERYSHVMHIVSDIRGTLRPEVSRADLIRATFPAGTVSGAPKVRAMQLIDSVEPTRRGLYGGATGVLSVTGDLDLAITLRSIILRNGVASVQAGAGIVFDSDPTKEYEETVNKARAALRAIEFAQQNLERN